MPPLPEAEVPDLEPTSPGPHVTQIAHQPWAPSDPCLAGLPREEASSASLSPYLLTYPLTHLPTYPLTCLAGLPREEASSASLSPSSLLPRQLLCSGAPPPRPPPIPQHRPSGGARGQPLAPRRRHQTPSTAACSTQPACAPGPGRLQMHMCEGRGSKVARRRRCIRAATCSGTNRARARAPHTCGTYSVTRNADRSYNYSRRGANVSAPPETRQWQFAKPGYG